MKFLGAIIVMVCAISATQAVSKRDAGEVAGRINFNGLVDLDIYYETLCPYSRKLIIGQLWDAFNQVGSILRVRLVPFGNARQTWNVQTKNWEFDCQHGNKECWGNLLQSCAIYNYPNINKHLPFVYCFMKDAQEVGLKQASEDCAARLNLDINVLRTCMASTLGNSVQHQNAVETENLRPASEYVPWIVLNGQHSEKIQSAASTNLVKLVCQSYKGPASSLPPVCSRF